MKTDFYKKNGSKKVPIDNGCKVKIYENSIVAYNPETLESIEISDKNFKSVISEWLKDI